MPSRDFYYMLDESHNPTACDVMTWVKWFKQANRRIKITLLPSGATVSTVFLGVSLGSHFPPVLYETMAFIPGGEDLQKRTDTEEEALKAHMEMVSLLENGKTMNTDRNMGFTNKEIDQIASVLKHHTWCPDIAGDREELRNFLLIKRCDIKESAEFSRLQTASGAANGPYSCIVSHHLDSWQVGGIHPSIAWGHTLQEAFLKAAYIKIHERFLTHEQGENK